MLRHLKDIKAKIEQKSIHNMKLPFGGPSIPPMTIFCSKMLISLAFDKSVTDQPTDGRTDGRTDERTDF